MFPACAINKQESEFEKATSAEIALLGNSQILKRLDVLCLPALWALGYLELHSLAFL